MVYLPEPMDHISIERVHRAQSPLRDRRGTALRPSQPPRCALHATRCVKPYLLNRLYTKGYRKSAYNSGNLPCVPWVDLINLFRPGQGFVPIPPLTAYFRKSSGELIQSTYGTGVVVCKEIFWRDHRVVARVQRPPTTLLSTTLEPP